MLYIIFIYIYIYIYNVLDLPHIFFMGKLSLPPPLMYYLRERNPGDDTINIERSIMIITIIGQP